MIPKLCLTMSKNLIPPTIISEMWNNLFPNMQQNDKSLQKVLGLGIVPMNALAEMFKNNKVEIKKAKKAVSYVGM